MTHQNSVSALTPIDYSSPRFEFWAYLAREAPKKYRYGHSDCPICLGLGIAYDAQGGDWNRPALVVCSCTNTESRCDGKPPYDYYDESSDMMLPCPSKKAHLALERIRYLQDRSRIPNRYKWKYLPSIEDRNNISQTLALSSVVSIIQQFGRHEIRGLYLHGDTGSGKTLFSTVIINELIRLYQTPVLYAKISRDILGKLRASFNPNSEIYGEGKKIEDELASIPALVIDDFGVQKDSDWVHSVLYDLIDARYENQLLTIITSNEPLDVWKEVSKGRIYSRLIEMSEELHIDVPDYRLGRG